MRWGGVFREGSAANDESTRPHKNNTGLCGGFRCLENDAVPEAVQEVKGNIIFTFRLSHWKKLVFTGVNNVPGSNEASSWLVNVARQLSIKRV
jgi:hypothetical protein